MDATALSLPTRRLILSANAVPLQGGQGLNLHHMLEGARSSFEVALFCRASRSDVPTHPVPDAPLSRLIGRVPVMRRLRDWQSFFSERHFDQYVAARLPKAEIFQGTTGQCLKSLQAARAAGCRTMLDVVTLHVDDFRNAQERDCRQFQVRPSVNERLRARMLQEYRQADMIRVMSERARESFLERGFAPERVTVVTPPVDCGQFPQAQFNEPTFRVSFVGLIEPWKGFHYLIEAFNSLNLPDSELILWGGTGARSISRYLQEQIARNPAIKMRPVEVRRLGYGEVYAKSSVLAHPSLADGFGYVVVEAMASGIPVIVTRETGAASLVTDGQNGYIVPPRDSEAIRDRLAHLAQHPSLLRAMGQAARDAARSLTFEKFRRNYVSRLTALCA